MIMTVPGGVDIAFSTGGLGRGATEHDSARAAAEALASGLSGIAIDGAALGDVPGVPEFVAAALRARDAQAAGVTQEGARRARLVGLVQKTSWLGEDMIRQTTAEAAAVPVDRPAG
jgi:hypothetical protein